MTTEFVTREAILTPLKRRFHEVDIPGWGTFRVRSLNELERSRFEASIRDKQGRVVNSKLVDLKCRLIVLCVVDEHGDPLLTDADTAALRQQDSKYTNLLVEEIQKHCGISDADLEELEKN